MRFLNHDVHKVKITHYTVNMTNCYIIGFFHIQQTSLKIEVLTKLKPTSCQSEKTFKINLKLQVTYTSAVFMVSFCVVD